MTTVGRILPFARNFAAGAALVLGIGGAGLSQAQAQILPPNPDPTCVVSQSEFNSWFKSGAPALNGAVNPADSLTLDTSTNCNFYKWSEQMFLWLTSPATAPYQGNRVFDSQVFYVVDGDTMKPQIPQIILPMPLRAAQAGPNGLPVVLDKAGHLREVVIAPSGPKGGALLRGAKGQTAEVHGVKADKDGKAVFLDAAGKPIAMRAQITADMLPKRAFTQTLPLLKAAHSEALSATDEQKMVVAALNKQHILMQFGSGKDAAFVDVSTQAVDSLEPGQAGSAHGVLLSKAGSVIFYEILVNDVYAYYLSGRKTGAIAPTYSNANPGYFPTTQADLQQILAYIQSKGAPAPTDPNALAMEVKLSWVDASTLPSTKGYITTQAQITTYNTSNPNQWVPNGSKPATLALVGAHVVGSATGHPEMIWATFEHQANTPLAQYTYNSGGATKTVPANTSGNWLFWSDQSGVPACAKDNGQLNVAHASYPAATQPNIVSANSHCISASNTMRMKAWGVASNGQPNQHDATAADSNTEVISLNTDVRAKLAAAGASADPRYNYLFIGSTWTMNGAAPNGQYPLNPGVYNEIGTSMLTNSTMETYEQGTDTTTGGGATNCFTCHAANTTNVSHEFSSLNPLP